MGFLYLLCVPICAGLGTIEKLDIAGFHYTGWMWLFFLAAGGVLLIREGFRWGGRRLRMPWGLWLLWAAYLWSSLCWCEPLEWRNVQDAVQITMPLLVGAVASLVVRSEEQLDRLLRVFVLTAILLGLCSVGAYFGLFAALNMKLLARPLGLTACLVGCVFMARFPVQRVVPLLGWGLCMVFTVMTGSRMATLALLCIPILHPLYRSAWPRIAAILTIAALGAALFYSPFFQNRFFYEGSGTLADVAEGDFLSFGRFEAWPDIWDEAWRRPYFGAGVGSAYNFVPIVWEGMHQVHNDYLRVGFELGLVGVALLVCALLWQVWRVWGQVRRSTGVVRTAFAAALLGFLLLAITSCTDNTLGYNLWYMDPLFVLLGAAYGVAGRDPAWSVASAQSGAATPHVETKPPLVASRIGPPCKETA
ncbi:MAG TPA: O-antigen ligase family protein [Gemmataceae bacterium]|nr:O-antigen ligase family protein [Gemmataceae bacterium]